LRDLTAATRAVAAGDLDMQVDVRSKDELGELARSFNQMSTELAHARDLRRQMTADIAHELRTPLSLILGHSEALSEGVLPPTGETLRVIHDEAKRLSRLVEDLRLLALSEAQELPLAFERASPQAVVGRAMNAHLPQARQKGISLNGNADPDLPDINVDQDRLAQVLDNLISNALRFTPPDGAVSLSATRIPDSVQIVVQDSGPGVPAEELPLIFDRFYRGDKARQRHEGGAGLGLAIARSIVEAHGGQIRAESAPGEGLRLTIELPIQRS
jgi:signal transduction histidine kinase